MTGNTNITNLLDVSTFAILSRDQTAIESLSNPALQLSGLQSSDSFCALSDGPLEMPENIRRHPEYHKWWARPGNAELAEARRANGKPFGLPLPIKE